MYIVRYDVSALVAGPAMIDCRIIFKMEKARDLHKEIQEAGIVTAFHGGVFDPKDLFKLLADQGLEDLDMVGVRVDGGPLVVYKPSRDDRLQEVKDLVAGTLSTAVDEGQERIFEAIEILKKYESTWDDLTNRVAMLERIAEDAAVVDRDAKEPS